MRIAAIAPSLLVALASLSGCREAPPPPTVASEFPEARFVVERSQIHPGSLGDAYRGGELASLASSGTGIFFLTTHEPIELIAFDAQGTVLWSHTGDQTPEGAFVNTIDVALVGDLLYVVDSGQEAMVVCDQEGRVIASHAFDRPMYEFASLGATHFVVYPSRSPEHLVDRTTAALDHPNPIIPYTGRPRDRMPGLVVCATAPNGNVMAASSPDLSVFALNEEGSMVRQIRLDEPALVADVEMRRNAVAERMREQPGLRGAVPVFTRIECSPDGALCPSTVQLDRASPDDEGHGVAVVYWLDSSGRPTKKLRGFGAMHDGLIPVGNERYMGIDAVTNLIVFYEESTEKPSS